MLNSNVIIPNKSVRNDFNKKKFLLFVLKDVKFNSL